MQELVRLLKQRGSRIGELDGTDSGVSASSVLGVGRDQKRSGRLSDANGSATCKIGGSEDTTRESPTPDPSLRTLFRRLTTYNFSQHLHSQLITSLLVSCGTHM